MIPPLNSLDNLESWKRQYIYNKFPVWFWKICCSLGIKHNYLLIEFHTHDPITGKELKQKSYGVYECVYCGRKVRE